MKNKRITIRLTDEEFEKIYEKAIAAYMPTAAYIRAAALRHKVMVVPGLDAVAHELKGIGRNLNQLTVLAHQGKISAARLDDTVSALTKVYEQLSALAAQEKR